MSEVVDLVRRFVELTDQRQALTDEMQEVEDLLTATLRGADQWLVELPGLPPIKRHGGKKRKEWQHDDLFRRIQKMARSANARLVIPDTGQIEAPEEAVVRLVSACAHIDYWRARDLQKVGIRPGDYCTESWGRETIEVIR